MRYRMEIERTQYVMVEIEAESPAEAECKALNLDPDALAWVSRDDWIVWDVEPGDEDEDHPRC